MKNRDKLQTCQRCHRKSVRERERKKTVLKFEELFEKWKRGDPTGTNPSSI